jgi:hypothetical protein
MLLFGAGIIFLFCLLTLDPKNKNQDGAVLFILLFLAFIFSHSGERTYTARGEIAQPARAGSK